MFLANVFGCEILMNLKPYIYNFGRHSILGVFERLFLKGAARAMERIHTPCHLRTRVRVDTCVNTRTYAPFMHVVTPCASPLPPCSTTVGAD